MSATQFNKRVGIYERSTRGVRGTQKKSWGLAGEDDSFKLQSATLPVLEAKLASIRKNFGGKL